jgi:hypothetical protein
MNKLNTNDHLLKNAVSLMTVTKVIEVTVVVVLKDK